METPETKNPVAVAKVARNRLFLRLVLTILGAFPAIAMLFGGWPWPLIWSLGVLSWGLYFHARSRAKRLPYFQELPQIESLSRDIRRMQSEVEARKSSWERDLSKAKTKVYGLEDGWGLPLMVCSPTSCLYELYLEADPAPSGFIQGALAFFSDNTQEQTVAIGSESTTSHRHESNDPNSPNYGRIASSTTSTSNRVRTIRSGSASVQIDGPQMVSGVLLFSSPSEAADFTNIFNRAATTTEAARSNLASNLDEAMRELAELQSLENSDFGAADIQQILADCPKPVIDWIGWNNAS